MNTQVRICIHRGRIQNDRQKRKGEKLYQHNFAAHSTRITICGKKNFISQHHSINRAGTAVTKKSPWPVSFSDGEKREEVKSQLP